MVPKTILDKIGIFTATPVLCVAIVLMLSFGEVAISEMDFYKDHDAWKENSFDYGEGGPKKRIEFYKSVQQVDSLQNLPYNVEWIKYSTWIYFSKSGDTIKRVRYKNDVEVHQ